VSTGGAATIAEIQSARQDEARAEAADNPLVQAILAAFPKARIADIRSPEALLSEAAAAALPLAEADDDWDPFEE